MSNRPQSLKLRYPIFSDAIKRSFTRTAPSPESSGRGWTGSSAGSPVKIARPKRDAAAMSSASIPAAGTGEVAYVIKGQRETLAARATDGAEIKRGHVVVIERVTGSVAHVRAKR